LFHTSKNFWVDLPVVAVDGGGGCDDCGASGVHGDGDGDERETF
jgi:hypothetical protein